MAENPSDLVGKEFIFEYGLDRIMPPSEKTDGTFALEQMAYRRERVVRCRDCATSDPCANPDYLICHRMECLVDPDGFCSWGEPREVE